MTLSSTPDPSKKIIIIGAGIGGLTAAIRLAAAGRSVLILEQNDTVGGKMGQVQEAGYRWDTGPSVITMKPVFEELFATAGRQLADYLTLLPVEPLTRYFYPDGTILDASQNIAKMSEQIAALEPRDVEGYLSFLAYAARLHRITGPPFIYGEPPSLQSLLRFSPLDTLKIDPWLTMDQAIRRHVRSPYLRQLLGRFATYVGASPYQAPATLSVIAHVELNQGVWYPKGGIYAIAQALERLALELGVEIRTNCPVQQIDVQQGQAIGVSLADGTNIRAYQVLANVDVTTVYEKLLPPTVATPRRRRALSQMETSCSGYIMQLGIEGEHPQLAHHNIFFSSDYKREFEDIFQHGRLPQEPTVYVAITSKRDPDHAPQGHENWFVLVNAPATDESLASEYAAYSEIVYDTLSRFGLEIRDKVRYEKIMTAADIAHLTGAWRGALYGISSNQALNAFRRPHNRSKEVDGLYFVGGATHPGGGVPMVMLSGKLVADMVMDNFSK